MTEGEGLIRKHTLLLVLLLLAANHCYGQSLSDIQDFITAGETAVKYVYSTLTDLENMEKQAGTWDEAKGQHLYQQAVAKLKGAKREYDAYFRSLTTTRLNKFDTWLKLCELWARAGYDLYSPNSQDLRDWWDDFVRVLGSPDAR